MHSTARSATRVEHVSCIQQAELSPDESCIATSDYDRTFSVYPVSAQKGSLFPYASFKSPEPIWTFAPYPYFDHSDPATCLVLLSTRDHFVSLHNVSDVTSISSKLHTYSNISPKDEALLVPQSLLFTSSGTTFLAGSRNLISLYDIYDQSGPISTFPTHARRDSQGYKGVVSALDINTDGVLAAGTWTRFVGLYDAEGSGSPITTISLPGGPAWNRNLGAEEKDLRGGGVTQLKWSPCGRYLCIAERQSDVLLLYDIRNMSIGLAHCKQRQARTKQKLGFQIWSGKTSDEMFVREGGAYMLHDDEKVKLGRETIDYEIWAGGTDGAVRVWRDPHLRQGGLEANAVVKVGEDPVVGTMVNKEGTHLVAATGMMDRATPNEDVGRKGLPRVRQRGAVDVFML